MHPGIVSALKKSMRTSKQKLAFFFLFLFFSSVSQVELGKQMVALGSAGTAHIPGIVYEFQFTPFRQVHYTDMSDYPTRSTLHSLFQNLRQKKTSEYDTPVGIGDHNLMARSELEQSHINFMQYTEVWNLGSSIPRRDAVRK